MLTVGEYLKRERREFPKPDCDNGRATSGEAYAKAGLPMVVACANCTMTFALTENRLCDEQGHVFCSAECAGEE